MQTCHILKQLQICSHLIRLFNIRATTHGAFVLNLFFRTGRHLSFKATIAFFALISYRRHFYLPYNNGMGLSTLATFFRYQNKTLSPQRMRPIQGASGNMRLNLIRNKDIKSVSRYRLFILFRLIQSHTQSGPPSASPIGKNTQELPRILCQDCIEFFFGFFSYFDHD